MVNPIKNQGQCGSSTAFATTAAIEACYKKASGRLGNYGEQQFLDCAYDFQGAKACEGAPINAYLAWSKFHSIPVGLSSTSQYPYKAMRGPCQVYNGYLDVGARITSSSNGFNVTEAVLRSVVADRGVALTTLLFNQRSDAAFRAYRGGIFNGCSPTGGPVVGGLAVTIVGYGTENNQDYWLIRNSWGNRWGEGGYMKLRRGVQACDIGREVATVYCEKSSSDFVKTVQDCPEGDEVCSGVGEGEGGEEEDEEGKGQEK